MVVRVSGMVYTCMMRREMAMDVKEGGKKGRKEATYLFWEFFPWKMLHIEI
jgi:hypothetical protein